MKKNAKKIEDEHKKLFTQWFTYNGLRPLEPDKRQSTIISSTKNIEPLFLSQPKLTNQARSFLGQRRKSTHELLLYSRSLFG